MGWLGLLKVLLGLASNIASIIREKQLMDAGEAKAVAKSLAEISNNAGIAQQTREAVAAMSDADIDKELEQ